jgi:hypothetical protein
MAKIYSGSLQKGRTLAYTEECRVPEKTCEQYNSYRSFEPISYRALLSTLLHTTVYMFLHNLLNVLVQIANKTGLRQKSL